MAVKKYINAGHVAVIYSPGYGLGWYVDEDEFGYAELMYAYDIAVYIDRHRDFLKNLSDEQYEKYYEGLKELVAQKFPGHWMLSDWAHADLDITWVPLGTPFRINEYDGNESVEIDPPFHLVNADGEDIFEVKRG